MRYFNVVYACGHVELSRLKMKRVTISPECVTDSKQLKKIKKKKERKKSVVFPSVTISR